MHGKLKRLYWYDLWDNRNSSVIAVTLLLQIARYNITVEAKDNGQPTAQTSQAIILIIIGDINDNRPTFSQLNYTGEVQVKRV